MAVKVETDSEPLILAELEVIDKSEPEPEPEAFDESEPDIIDEPELKVEESFIENLIELPLEPTIELVSSLTAILLRSPDVYDPSQIFL